MAGRASKAKGSSYENKLVKLLEGEGFGAYRVPLSGALGHQSNSKLPPNLKRALSGDVGCELMSSLYIPFEVKYRSGAEGFKALYTAMHRGGYMLCEYDDCYVFPESDMSFLHGTVPQARLRIHKPALTDTLRGWYVDAEVLALRAADEPWLFVLQKEHHDS